MPVVQTVGFETSFSLATLPAIHGHKRIPHFGWPCRTRVRDLLVEPYHSKSPPPHSEVPASQTTTLHPKKVGDNAHQLKHIISSYLLFGDSVADDTKFSGETPMENDCRLAGPRVLSHVSLFTRINPELIPQPPPP